MYREIFAVSLFAPLCVGKSHGQVIRNVDNIVVFALELYHYEL